MGSALNLIGQKFGRLTVVSDTSRRPSGAVLWNCICECGNNSVVISSALRSGQTQSCGCSGILDITNQRFSRLLVLNITNLRSSDGAVLWSCKCDCGNKVNVRSADLRFDHTKSCGCFRIEISSINGSNNTTHGMTGTPEYYTWTAIIQRCINSNKDNYHNYGGRGITVCDRWLNSFENFYVDMGPRPSDAHSIDRYPNNDGNYEPGNCRWGTQEEQCNNTRENIIVNYKGKEYTASQLAREYDMEPSTIIGRLRLGWTVADAVEKPIKHFSRGT